MEEWQKTKQNKKNLLGNITYTFFVSVCHCGAQGTYRSQGTGSIMLWGLNCSANKNEQKVLHKANADMSKHVMQNYCIHY